MWYWRNKFIHNHAETLMPPRIFVKDVVRRVQELEIAFRLCDDTVPI